MARMRERIVNEQIRWWARETGFTPEILKAAIRRGDLRATRPSGFERGPLYINSDDMQEWLDSIQVNAPGGAA